MPETPAGKQLPFDKIKKIPGNITAGWISGSPSLSIYADEVTGRTSYLDDFAWLCKWCERFYGASGMEKSQSSSSKPLSDMTKIFDWA